MGTDPFHCSRYPGAYLPGNFRAQQKMVVILRLISRDPPVLERRCGEIQMHEVHQAQASGQEGHLGGRGVEVAYGSGWPLGYISHCTGLSH